jgi:hypothetical protein
MATLHIEHAITDLRTWRAAFDRFAEHRTAAGVVAHRITQPVDDDHYVVLQLDFTSTERAVAFRGFLETQVWSTPANSPGLAGSPRAVVLDVVDQDEAETTAGRTSRASVAVGPCGATNYGCADASI